MVYNWAFCFRYSFMFPFVVGFVVCVSFVLVVVLGAQVRFAFVALGF